MELPGRGERIFNYGRRKEEGQGERGREREEGRGSLFACLPAAKVSVTLARRIPSSVRVIEETAMQ